MYVCAVCVRAYVHTGLQRPEEDIRYPALHSPPYFFRTGSFIDLGVGLVTSIPPISVAQSTGISGVCKASSPGSLQKYGSSNLGPPYLCSKHFYPLSPNPSTELGGVRCYILGWSDMAQIIAVFIKLGDLACRLHSRGTDGGLLCDI